MTAISMMGLLLFISGLTAWVAGIWLHLKRRRIRHKIRVEITQRHFAEARNALMELVLKGELDPRSATFQRLYYLNTHIMRRPDQYQEISQVLKRTISRGHKDDLSDPLLKETHAWTLGIKKAVLATADAMRQLIFNYSWLLRTLFRLQDRFKVPVVPILQGCSDVLERLIVRAQSVEEKKHPFLSDIRETRTKMYDL
ncbi:MAG: hypothetical protein ACREAB_04660, partial [Blastocatellia bacterium]